MGDTTATTLQPPRRRTHIPTAPAAEQRSCTGERNRGRVYPWGRFWHTRRRLHVGLRDAGMDEYLVRASLRCCLSLSCCCPAVLWTSCGVWRPSSGRCPAPPSLVLGYIHAASRGWRHLCPGCQRKVATHAASNMWEMRWRCGPDGLRLCSIGVSGSRGVHAHDS
jgi:hypothetical protein